MRLSDSNLEKIRQHPQQTKVFLSLFRPQPVFKARVNDASSAQGDRLITYNSVTLGSYTAISTDALLLVGSTDGARDLGTVRVRSATSSVLTVAENSHVLFADNAYLTVLKYWNVDAKYPRIINDPNNDESVIFYKDYDVSYTNQNSALGAFANAGPHRAIFRDPASGLAQTSWSSTGTHGLIAGTTFNYGWTFEGGTPSSSTSANPGTVAYNAPGHYVTDLVVSGSNGAIDTAHRYVSVYDYPGQGTGTPPLKWELKSLQGSRTEGGYTVDIVLHEIVDINEGDVVVLFTEDWYGSEKVSLGGNHPGASSILFSGYVTNDTIRVNYRNSTVQFQAGSISMLMKNAEGFSISVESAASPSVWYEMLDMDVRRAIYHYLKWHSTVLLTTDFQFVGTDRKIQFYDSDRSSLYDAIDSLIRGALVGEVVSDRQGKLWAEVQASFVPDATGTYTPVMELTKRDWINEPSIEENLSGKTSFVELGGIAYSGTSTGTYAALMANAPGSAPAYRGRVEKQQGLALGGQSQLNQLAGNMFANRNARYPSIEVDLGGNYGNLDIAPQEAVLVDMLPEDTAKGVRIRSPYLTSGMQFNFDSKAMYLYPHITLDQITSGVSGETITIPPVPSEGGGYKVPGIQIPSLPALTFPSFAPGTGSSCCDYFSDLGIGQGVYCCLLIRGTQSTPSYSPSVQWIPQYDYASNYQMYEVSSNRVKFLSSGTITYNISLEADYADSSDGDYAGQLTCQLYNAAGSIIGGTINVQLNAIYQQSGHASATQTITNVNLKSNNFLRVIIPTVNSPDTISCAWSDIRLNVCGS